MNGVHAAKHAVVDRGNERSCASKKTIVTKTKYVSNRNYNCTSSVQCIMHIASWKESRKRCKIKRYRSIKVNICGRTKNNRSEKMTNKKVQTNNEIYACDVHVENKKKYNESHRTQKYTAVCCHLLLFAPGIVSLSFLLHKPLYLPFIPCSLHPICFNAFRPKNMIKNGLKHI